MEEAKKPSLVSSFPLTSDETERFPVISLSLSLSKNWKKKVFPKSKEVVVCFVHIWQSLALIPLNTHDERAVDYGRNNLHLDFEPSRSELEFVWCD